MQSVCRVTRYTSALVVTVLFMSLTTNNAALAGIDSTRSLTHGVTTMKWGNVLTDVGTAISNVPYTYTWAQSTGSQFTYVDIVNIGDLTTIGNTLTVSTQDATSSRQDAPNLTFTSCTGGIWNQITNMCSGKSTTLGTVTNGTLNSNFSLSAGQRATIQIIAQKTKKALWTSTISISVSRSQVRTATTTNS